MSYPFWHPMSGVKGGLKCAVIIFIIFMLLTVCLACSNTLSTRNATAIGAKVAEVSNIAGLPVANIHYTSDETFGGSYPEGKAAEADCGAWSITFNYPFAASRPGFVINKVVPHEYAHLMSCQKRQTIGADPHDDYWRKLVIQLGGDPDYV